MNKFIVYMSVLALFASMYVFHRIDHIFITVTPYSQENVERVRANIPKTLPKPVQPVKVVQGMVEIPYNVYNCLQTNIYFESGNQSYTGKVGTAWVTLNRLNHSRFPNTICSVVKQAKLNGRGNPIRHRCQFSWYCDGLSDTPDLHNRLEREAWEVSGQIAGIVIASCLMGYQSKECPPDPTNGALFYHADTVDPQWGYVKTAVVENHTYYGLN